MTADERIEKLLNRFGQTIYDLPKPQTADYAYVKCHIGKAYETATEWHGRLNSGSLDTGDYICHLADVIDRMETALETALRCLNGTCNRCRNFNYGKESSKCDECYDEISFEIRDKELTGLNSFDFEEFVIKEKT